MQRLEDISFVNDFLDLGNEFFSFSLPEKSDRPFLVCSNPDAMQILNLDPEQVKHPRFVDYFSGNQRIPGSIPVCLSYAGDSFGNKKPLLGDGRAHLLGQIKNQHNQLWDIQLKGSGKSPYSGQLDGRSALNSCIREYLGSEAMHFLGIPTTRALCLVGTHNTVMRKTEKKAGVLTRLAPTHVRFGSFEIFHYQNKPQNIKRLADYIISNFYPELQIRENPYLALLETVIEQTSKLIAQWQSVGFCHGVLNSDNMSILSLTLDYGPYAFMETYNANLVCHDSDKEGLYAFNQQPKAGFNNLSYLAKTFLPILVEDQQLAEQLLTQAIEQYWCHYQQYYVNFMRQKLGLYAIQSEDILLINNLMEALHKNQVDYSLFFRQLSQYHAAERVLEKVIGFEQMKFWFQQYSQRISNEAKNHNRGVLMKQTNPKYILRKNIVESATKLAQKGDFSELNQLLTAIKNPYDSQPEFDYLAQI